MTAFRHGIKQQQLATLREWIAAAKTRTYKQRDKRRYIALSLRGDITSVTMEPTEAIAWIDEQAAKRMEAEVA